MLRDYILHLVWWRHKRDLAIELIISASVYKHTLDAYKSLQLLQCNVMGFKITCFWHKKTITN